MPPASRAYAAASTRCSSKGVPRPVGIAVELQQPLGQLGVVQAAAGEQVAQDVAPVRAGDADTVAGEGGGEILVEGEAREVLQEGADRARGLGVGVVLRIRMMQIREQLLEHPARGARGRDELADPSLAGRLVEEREQLGLGRPRRSCGCRRPGRQGRSTRVNGGGLRNSSICRAASSGAMPSSAIWRRSCWEKRGSAAGSFTALPVGRTSVVVSMLQVRMQDSRQNLERGRVAVLGAEQRLARPASRSRSPDRSRDPISSSRR